MKEAFKVLLVTFRGNIVGCLTGSYMNIPYINMSFNAVLSQRQCSGGVEKMLHLLYFTYINNPGLDRGRHGEI